MKFACEISRHLAFRRVALEIPVGRARLFTCVRLNCCFADSIAGSAALRTRAKQQRDAFGCIDGWVAGVAREAKLRRGAPPVDAGPLVVDVGRVVGAAAWIVEVS